MIISAIEETFFTWASANTPFLAVIALAAWVIWHTRGMVSDYNSRLANVESSCTRLDATLKAVDERLTKVERKLDVLIAELRANRIISPTSFSSHSPIQLTDASVKLLNDMGGREYIDERLDKFLSEIEKENFKSCLDVQNFCIDLCYERLRDGGMVPIKDYIYNTPIFRFNGTAEIRVDVSLAMHIMGIYLRNRYFERRQA